MPFDYSSILSAQRERIETEQARERANLEAARLSDDEWGTMHSASRILELDAQMAALATRANQFVAQQQAQPRSNAYGLSDDEIAVARNSHSGGSVEERIRDYAANKQKLAYMRATGQYRDDQGTVSR